MPEIVMTPQVMGRMGGHAHARNMSPEARKASSQKAYLAGAVRSIAKYRDQLSEEQRDILFEVLFPGGEAA
jgi:hypothetical protein